MVLHCQFFFKNSDMNDNDNLDHADINIMFTADVL